MYSTVVVVIVSLFFDKTTEIPMAKDSMVTIRMTRIVSSRRSFSMAQHDLLDSSSPSFMGSASTGKGAMGDDGCSRSS